ncbi:carbohydrate ABC transporter permease [Anaerocolumna xylanovorans]|uniref:Lactose/L-arabinose transport system permease protein n=1 Tax=Anaerocolumna xylanovorans DSM 12503 TaxID=1121345 RepID=A0A1M7Y5C5_9FIRM|nr:carbohydrate ABC transporter permease [Anaerocolumna xylanovorans]SHO47642.1 lactose/L-arabinose transport system permease protein [Anaerocolumna xylanovorans DSM 12503]
MIRRGKRVLQYVFLTVVSILSVFPIYYMICGATNKSADVVGGRLLPGSYLVSNFQNLILQQNLSAALWNSIRNATIMTLLSLLICSIAGYGFEIYHDKGKDLVMAILLLAMMIPFAVIMIPLFRMFSHMKLINTMTAIVLPAISTPFLIMLFRQSARSFPHDIIEAARIDGLNEMGIFFRMFIPTMRSTYAAAMTITFMGAWNNYLWPKIVLQTNNSITMPVLVANSMGGHYVDYGMLMISVLICTIPTAIIFFALQKNFAEGITGAVK